MKAGTVVRLPDGREGTVVYNGLDGVGIKWGIHDVTIADMRGTGGLFDTEVPEDYDWTPDAMLRDPFPGADGMECVGGLYSVIRLPREE